MSNIMKQLRDLREYLGDFLRCTDTDLAIFMMPDNFEITLYDSHYHFQHYGTNIALSYDDNLEVNELGDMIIKKYHEHYLLQFCDRNCDWCGYRTSEGCELMKGNVGNDTDKI